MREIKFRAWDAEENKFWYFTLQEILERRMSYRGSWDDKILRCEKTQYIGLNDKNGKEIYEKDIVVFDCYSYEEPENTYTGEIIYSNGNSCFSLSGYDEWSKVEYVPLCEIGGSYTTIIEVIGNIHENPELLEDKSGEN